MPERSLNSSVKNGSADGGFLNAEDYQEPRCLLCDPPSGSDEPPQAVPQQRILSKLDAYMARRDYDGARRHLLYWLEEARAGRDLRGELLVCNELIGFFRKTGDRSNALHYVEQALALLKTLDFEGTLSAGTTYVNAATACHAFGEYERAFSLFGRARSIYESKSGVSPSLLGGLYNNMALNLAALENYEEAFRYYEKALDAMRQVPGGSLEQAISLLNMADALDAGYGMEIKEQEIFALLDQAYDLLDGSDAPRDGYYAFVCEKCAPAFSYYGYFQAAAGLEERAREIYANYTE